MTITIIFTITDLFSGLQSIQLGEYLVVELDLGGDQGSHNHQVLLLLLQHKHHLLNVISRELRYQALELP